MVARLLVVCAAEAALVVLLAVQVFAGREPAAPRSGTGAASASQGPADPAATMTPGSPPTPGSPIDSLTPARAEATAKWRDGDPVGILLTGTLRLRDGQPAPAWMNASLAKTTRNANAAADGRYALVGLQPGEWTVRLGGTGVVEQTATVALGDDAVQHHDFVLDPAFPVRVRIVTADGGDASRALGKALPEFAEFTVAGQREPFPERLAPTDYGRVFVGDAKWENQRNSGDGVAGTLHFAALPAHAALLQRHLVLAQKVVSPGQTELEFVVDIAALAQRAGSATVRVLDADTGAAVTGARVSLLTSNRGGGGRVVDAEGRAALEGLPPGLLRCQITAKGHESMYTTVRVGEGQRLDLGDVRLGPSVPLAGTVLDADGKPAATAELAWTELKWRTSPIAFGSNRGARADAEGKFSLFGTGRGAIAVSARDPDGNVAVGVFDNPPGSPIVLRLVKPDEFGKCTVTRPADPARAFTVTLFDGRRRPIAAREVEPRFGKITIALPAGEYPFEVHDEQDRLVQSGTLTFGAAPCTLEIR